MKTIYLVIAQNLLNITYNIYKYIVLKLYIYNKYMITIGVIGNGFVGKATSIFKCKKIKLYNYDIVPKLCFPLGTTLKDICDKCDIILISVPTPMNKDGSCYLKIVETVVGDISKHVDLDEKIVVLRSTVPPGTSDRLNCYFMPEFLTEKNFMNDFRNNPNWIFGLKGTKQDIVFKEKIFKLINFSHVFEKIKYNKICLVKNKEAEMIKLFRNNFLATKVSFCNEMAEFCKIKEIDYENVRKYAVLDPRIGESHSKVPGHDGKRGFGGTCLPKDTKSLSYEMNNSNMKSYIIDSVINRNSEVDRPEQDWNNKKGRSVV